MVSYKVFVFTRYTAKFVCLWKLDVLTKMNPILSMVCYPNLSLIYVLLIYFAVR